MAAFKPDYTVGDPVVYCGELRSSHSFKGALFCMSMEPMPAPLMCFYHGDDCFLVTISGAPSDNGWCACAWKLAPPGDEVENRHVAQSDPVPVTVKEDA